MSVVDDVRNGSAQIEWAEVVSKRDDGTQLRIAVMRDGLKVDGVRVAANAQDLQRIADILRCLLLTPKVVDLIYEQAIVKFDPVIRVDGGIVAVSNSRRVSALIDAEIERQGGDQGGLVDSVGKYWVLHNHLASPGALKHGKSTVCNYGWLSTTGGYAALTPGLRCWQSPEFGHDDLYADPSQLVRLMKREAMLARPDQPEERVDLLGVLTDPTLADLVNHDGVLKYLRIANVPETRPEPPVQAPIEAPEEQVEAPLNIC